jgi:hypothetical protein
MFLMVAGAVTMSARVPGEQADRGSSGDPARVCRARDLAENATKDLAPALVRARTVFLISEVAPGDSGRLLNDARHELQRWHRWEEISRRDAADVTLSISVIRGEGGGETLELGIRAKATGTVLWASSGRDVAAALRVLEARLPSPEGVCAPIQVL